MIIKICRVRDPENIHDIMSIRPNMMGFDFCSSRVSFIGEVDESLLSTIPSEILKVGLFRNEPPVQIAAIAGKFTLDAIQLDGDTSSAECEILTAEGLNVIKSFYISTPASFDKTIDYEGVCNMFIFKPSTTIDLSILEHYRGTTPFLLSLRMDNIAIPVIIHPHFAGFDTASSCEISPTLKNVPALSKLVANIRSTAAKIK